MEMESDLAMFKALFKALQGTVSEAHSCPGTKSWGHTVAGNAEAEEGPFGTG